MILFFSNAMRFPLTALMALSICASLAQSPIWSVKWDTFMRSDTLAWKAKDVAKLLKGTQVELIRSQGTNAFVRYKGMEGYVWVESLSDTPPKPKESGADVLQRLEERQKEIVEGYHKAETERTGRTEERRSFLVNKYGEKRGMDLYEGTIWVGMSKAMAIDSWGEPTRMNTSGGAGGEREQWVYGEGRYLYFQDGKLESWQQ